MFKKVMQLKFLDIISRNYVRRARNPGLERRLRVFSDDVVKNDSEFLEDMESDFMDVHKVHKQFEGEEKKYNKKIQMWITKNKYFKEKNINFLTWSEKEQIRHLYQLDPYEWNFERLTDSFPADSHAITKIIKSKWTPQNAQRVTKHDEAVRKTWEEFKNKALEVEPELEQHLLKFAHRNFNDACIPKIKRNALYDIKKPEHNEFSSIITSCSKYSENEQKSQEDTKLLTNKDQLKIPNRRPKTDKDSFLFEGNKNDTKLGMMRLKDFQIISPDTVNKQENLISNESHIDLTQNKLFSNLNIIKKNREVAVASNFDDDQVHRSLEIKENIRIPRKLWKKDKLYKVSDCFYDDDGEFLYRVPGFK
ncbi:unnamed protein product [Diamesa serratosioi]